MKKVVSLLLSIMVLCCTCLSGCNSQTKQSDAEEIRAEDIEVALIAAGYSEAHIEDDDSYWNSVYLDNTETDYILERNPRGDVLPFISFSKERNDIPEILDAVMPLYDKKYRQGDGEKIMRGIINTRRTRYSDGEKCGGKIIFNGYEYSEILDDETKSFTKIISLDR